MPGRCRAGRMPVEVRRNEDAVERETKVWQIGWKEKRGGELRILETDSIWRVLLWVAGNLNRCVIAVITRLQDD